MNNSNIKKILLVKLRGIGDVILSTIVLDNIKAKYPDSQIDFLTEYPGGQVLINISEINDILILEKKNFLSTLKLIWKIRKNKYDIIFDFYSNPRTAIICFLSNAKLKFGYTSKTRKFAYNQTLDTLSLKIHNAEINLELIKLSGIPIISKNLKYNIAQYEFDLALNYFKNNKLGNSRIAIIPGGGWKSKKCEPEVYIKICKMINAKFGFNFIILYSNDDLHEAQIIYNELSEISILGPNTSIRELAAYIKQCIAVITNDSGPMHLSTAINIPTFAIFGPTNPYLQGPYGKIHKWIRNENLDCINCDLLNCPKNHECMTQLSLEYIEKEFKDFIVINKLK